MPCKTGSNQFDIKNFPANEDLGYCSTITILIFSTGTFMRPQTWATVIPLSTFRCIPEEGSYSGTYLRRLELSRTLTATFLLLFKNQGFFADAEAFLQKKTLCRVTKLSGTRGAMSMA